MISAAARPRPDASARAASRSPWLSRVLLLNLALEALIIVTGGTVRLTASGLGCPTWPQCTGDSFVPVAGQAEGFHRFIEFGNRTLTGAVGFAAIACIVAVLRWAPERRRALLPWAWTVLAGVAAQAVLGGITVLTRLHPATVAAHFLLSGLLVVASTVLVWREREGDGPRVPVVPGLVRRLAWGAVATFAVVMVLGTVVTGAGPHAGDAAAFARFDVSPRAVSWLHADAVMLFIGLVVAMVVATRLAGDDRRAPQAWTAVLTLSLLQGALGYVQYVTKLPWVLVLTHMAGATVLAVAVTCGVLALRRRD